MTRKHTNSTIDLVNLSQRFASHAFSLLDAERGTSSLTLLQSAAILWVYSRNEGSRMSLAQSANLVGLLQQTWAALGLESNGASLFKFSEEVTDDVGVWQAISSIAWGFYCFFAKMALVTSSQMPISRPLIMKIFEAQDGLDASSQSSTSSASEDPFAAQAAYQVQVFTAECSLCEIMDQLVSGFIRGGNRRVIRDEGHCTALYNKLLCWKLTLPEHLTTSRSVSPSVLMLQSTYDFVALEMLSAFTRHSGVSFDGRNATSLQILHANSLVTNLWIYRGIYTLKHEYWAAEYCSFTAHTLLPFVETETAVHDVIAKACCILYEMGGKSGVSSRATSLLREVEETARDRSIRIPYYGKGSKSPESDGAPMVTVHGARVFGSAGGGTAGGAGWYPASVTFSGTISDIEPAQAEVSGG
nr:nitrogen assimilation transcription factor nira [Colletotrichum truncatum]KAF6800545.1 nitrogen assimilation transcription factor nira [Colletotrichum truncatum]